MQLAPLVHQYLIAFRSKYAAQLLPGHLRAIGAIRRCRTLRSEDFLWLVLQHVLPKGFRRVRDYGFLHGNARKLLILIQLTLKVMITARPIRPRPVFICVKCQSPMRILGFIRPAWPSG